MKKFLCWVKDQPWLMLLSGLLLLLLLILLRQWLFVWLLLYLAVLVFLGLIGLVRFAQGILRQWCAKAFGDPKGTGSAGHPPSKGTPPPHTYKRPDPDDLQPGLPDGEGLGGHLGQPGHRVVRRQCPRQLGQA